MQRSKAWRSHREERKSCVGCQHEQVQLEDAFQRCRRRAEGTNMPGANESTRIAVRISRRCLTIAHTQPPPPSPIGSWEATPYAGSRRPRRLSREWDSQGDFLFRLTPNRMRINDIPPQQRREMLNQEELARRLDLCTRQVRNLTEQGMPRVEEQTIGSRFGSYPWPLVLHWYVGFKVREAAIRSAAADARRSAPRRRRPTPFSLPCIPGASE